MAHMRFCETTRGRGKIFIRIAAEGLAEDARIEVSASTKEGRAVPASIMRVPGVDGWVLMLAVLSVTQYVELVAYGGDGIELARARKTIATLAAQLYSRANTVRHNAVAECMRNADERVRPGALVIDTGELVINNVLGCEMLRGTVRIAASAREEAMASVELAFLGDAGQDVSLEPWLCMGDAVERREDGICERVLSYSVKLPANLGALVVWARSACLALGEGFETCEGFVLEEKRTAWRGETVPTDADPQYERWFLTRHRVSQWELQLQRCQSPSDDAPLFSLVVPLYHTPIEFFHELVASVQAQSYGSFELLLVNASPEDEALGEEAARAAATDNRIRVVPLAQNLGIARNTLAGVHAAKGDFVAFLDHDDVLEPDALYCYAQGIARYPQTDLLYCDEDKLLGGHYVNAFLKPDWNLDLLRSVNYVCHLLAVRRSVVEAMPEEEYVACEGAQDHALCLFAGERARNVYHARRVLYHWRIHEGSTAATGDAKTYASQAGVRAVQAHLDRCGLQARAQAREDIPNTYRVSYPLDEHPLVSIVIPNKDLVPVLRRCVESVLSTSTYDAFEIVVVENNSEQDETFAYYEELQTDERVRVVRLPERGSFNFSRIVNFGVEAARGEYVLLLNNDTEVITPDWIERLLGICRRPDVGIVGAKLLYPDGLIQHGGVMFHRGGPRHLSLKLDRNTQDYFHLPQLTQDLTAVTGACLMVARSTFAQVGGFDEEYPVDYNDVDFCLRVKELGLLVVYEPLVELYHHESISRGGHDSNRMKVSWTLATGRLMQRWPKYFAIGDPYLHPNFFFNEYRRLFFWE